MRDVSAPRAPPPDQSISITGLGLGTTVLTSNEGLEPQIRLSSILRKHALRCGKCFVPLRSSLAASGLESGSRSAFFGVMSGRAARSDRRDLRDEPAGRLGHAIHIQRRIDRKS